MNMAEEVRGIRNEPRVDLLFHCAGVLHEDGHMPETSLSQVEANFLRRNLEVCTPTMYTETQDELKIRCDRKIEGSELTIHDKKKIR